MANATPKARQGRRVRGGSEAEALAGSGSGRSGRDHVGDGTDRGGSSVGWRLLAALVRDPGRRQELADPGHGPVVGESPKGVAEVLEGRCADEVAVHDEGVQDREAPRASVGAGEQEVVSTDGRAALLALDMGVGQRDPRIVEEHDQGRPLVDGVRDGVAQGALGRGAAGQVGDEPMEAIDDRSAVALPAAQEFVAVHAFGARLGLDRVELTHRGHHHRCAGVSSIERFERIVGALRLAATGAAASARSAAARARSVAADRGLRAGRGRRTAGMRAGVDCGCGCA